MNKKHIITETIHNLIKDKYTDPERWMSLPDLSDQTGISKTQLSLYASTQGWIKKIKKQPAWSEKEFELLRRNAHHSTTSIQYNLKKHGFNRTITAIEHQLHRNKIKQSLDGYNCDQLALAFGVGHHTILRYIKLGYLKASKRKVTADPNRDPYWVIDMNIKRFVMEYIDEIDLSKVEKHWFVDLLTDPFIKTDKRERKKKDLEEDNEEELDLTDSTEFHINEALKQREKRIAKRLEEDLNKGYGRD